MCIGADGTLMWVLPVWAEGSLCPSNIDAAILIGPTHGQHMSQDLDRMFFMKPSVSLVWNWAKVRGTPPMSVLHA